MNVGILRHGDAVAGEQKAAVAQHQLGWQQATAEQFLRAVQVDQDAIQQRDTLR